MIIRSFTKARFLVLLLVCLFLVGIIYLYVNNLQVTYENAQSEDRCISELTSIKYQLNVVTEYKNRIDKLLTERQKAHNYDREKFKDIVESCLAMKQQTSICQSQFEDLQSECKKVKEDYYKLSKDVVKLKTT